ncbi:BREX-2 system phosphatase PglZ [Nocardia iowensis]|uniref:BREX-2 system phosphatase PglZ n=1 Tax=Nocardia iowensis TaxID=204891 RepID=A0ABX8RUA3_NOCIO|nr:BREX-2 system phosphatase PglZ [Nocardia iowensis]QXN93148.1 BREX-2 system phosphatase PglZ [Nocardia iowensis]
MTLLVATRPIITAKLESAIRKRYRPGVLGLHAQPVWRGDGFSHHGVPVTVAACPSVLAVWEAIGQRKPGEWLVILTSAEQDELGIGLLAHLHGAKLETPLQWDAVRDNFSAATLEPALYRVRENGNDRALADGLLAVIDEYRPAPGGVLTRDHAFTTVAQRVLHITDEYDTEIDAFTVLEWSLRPGADHGLRILDTVGGAELSAAVTGWLAQRCGRVRRPVAALLTPDLVADLLPLGLIAGLFDGSSGADRSLGHFESTYRLRGITLEELRAWYDDTTAVLTGVVHPSHRDQIFARAEKLVDNLGLNDLATGSEQLRPGLEARLHVLSAAIDVVMESGREVTAAALDTMETAWQDVQRHLLADTDPTCTAYRAAVRLVRWLHTDAQTPAGITRLTHRHVNADAWADAAIAAAYRGADTARAAETLRRVIEAAQTRRRDHDRQFASALAATSEPEVLGVEHLVRRVVVPIVKRGRQKQPVLLLVLDGLSMAMATELAADAMDHGWSEAAVPGVTTRTGALAVLPSLTHRSRGSLLCGQLTEVNSEGERAGFRALLAEHSLSAPSDTAPPIFHKGQLDAVIPGQQLATEVRNAIADTQERPLVAAVLNYIDTMLHKVGVGDADWNVRAIPHLRHLLAAARTAGRIVVITADHGHVVDRRNGIVRHPRVTYNHQRAHGDLDAVGEGEVLVAGSRVLTDSSSAVLAVDDRIHYGPVNAGYHGGGSPAEVVVPVLVLCPGDRPTELAPLNQVEPSWWSIPLSAATSPATEPPTTTRRTRSPANETPTLFEPELVAPATRTRPALLDELLATPVFASQLQLAGRLAVTTEQIADLLTALLAASAHEITSVQAATVLSVATARVNGALLQVKRVLDVEGYEVLLIDRDQVRLEVPVLREQFGLTS